jgi:heme-degrading monooxygenase HmoA
MIIRIVKMTFRHEEIENFLGVFDEVKEQIRNFEGCRDLALWKDVFHLNVLFTYSIWDSEEHLNAYRDSELFSKTWARTKSRFAGKPEAWSVEQLVGSINNKTM